MRVERIAVPLLLITLASNAFAGYAYKALVAFTGASGSTQSDITLVFSFSDTKLAYKTTTGGQIQNLCSRNGGTNNVPCDFVFTDDSTCASVTGSYTWGFDGDYDSAAGTGHGWVKIPSYTTSGVTPTVCFGDSSVSTYQGGSDGSEFDASTVSVFHLANGTTLSGTDFKGAQTPTITAATATTGKIDGAGSFNGTTAKIAISPGITPATAFTFSAWIKPTNVSNYHSIVGGAHGSFGLRTEAGSGKLFATQTQVADDTVSTIGVTINAWNHVVFVQNASADYSYYINGVQRGSFSGGRTGFDPVTAIGVNPALSEFFPGLIDEVRFDSTNRSGDWIATEYANQNAPPVLGSFTPIAIPSGFVAIF
jgi:hypothetical protein